MLDVRKAVLLGLLLIGLLLVAAAPASAGGATGSPVLFSRLEYYAGAATPASLRADARRYNVMVMWSDSGPDVRILHRLNPRLQILMYQNVSFTVASDHTGGMDCTTVPQDLAHPGWLARTASGAPVAAGGDYSTNLGNPSYQHACFAHAIALAEQGGFNGIFLDGISSKFSWTMPQGTARPAAFPTDTAYQAAVYSLLSYGGSTVRGAGLKLYANVAAVNGASWAELNGPLDGAMEESWTDGGQGPAQQVPWWREKLANVGWSQAHGKYVLLHTYSRTEAGNTYGLAAMLLVANGRATYETSTNYLTSAPWLPEYTTAQRLGAARGGYRILRSGLYERVFANGIVLVNPTFHRARRVSLHGRYSGTHLRHVRSVSLAPFTAVILTRS